jgi:hypothetical protein
MHGSSSAARTLCCWVEQHLDAFRPLAAAELPLLEHVKPLGDLALVLWALTAPGSLGISDEFTGWAAAIGNELWPSAEQYGKALPWHAMPDYVAEHPFMGLALSVYPVLEMVTDRRFEFDRELSVTVADTFARGLPPSLELAFAADVFRLGDCRPRAVSKVQAILKSGGESSGTSNLYLLCHAIFYSTWMGRRSLPIDAACRASWADEFARFANERVADRNYDLAAELLMCAAWLAPDRQPRATQAIQRLRDIAQTEGSIPPHPRLSRPGAGVFANRYHPTIVGLGVLALDTESE